jgi:arginine dihydrolase
MNDSVRPRFLMCRPDHYAVTYAINPWMDPAQWKQGGAARIEAARQEWNGLRDVLKMLGGEVELVAPATGVPDLVFTANSAVVLDGKALLASFRHPQRQREQPHYATAFQQLVTAGRLQSYAALPTGIVLEGAGDCIWDATRGLFWVGAGPRSSSDAAWVVEDVFGMPAVVVELADPRFYHLDTAMSVLANGEIMYFDGALTEAGRHALFERVAAEYRIEASEADACRMAANCISLGNIIVMSSCSDDLQHRLSWRGYTVWTTPLPSFLLSGGSAFCLTLRLDLCSQRSASLGPLAATRTAERIPGGPG